MSLPYVPRPDRVDRPHAIPIGALVEITPDPDDPRSDGVRLYVAYHHHDCDGSPLYALAAHRDDTEPDEPGRFNRGWSPGWPEHAPRVVRPPDS